MNGFLRLLELKSSFDKWSGATFDETRQYRYTLWRTWNPELPQIIYILLNPSTADETKNDPTVQRCQQRTLALKEYGGFFVLNIFAFRATKPISLYAMAELGEDPIGTENDAEIRRIVEWNSDSMILCGWGKHGNLLERGHNITKMLQSQNRELHCFGVNGDGTPKHPLYLPYSLQPTLFGGNDGEIPTQPEERSGARESVHVSRTKGGSAGTLRCDSREGQGTGPGDLGEHAGEPSPVTGDD